MSEKHTYTNANFAMHLAFLAKICADWAGSTLSLESYALDNVDPQTVFRFTAEIRERLSHLDGRAALISKQVK